MVDAAVGGALLGMCLGVRVDHGGLVPQTSPWHICRPLKLPRKHYMAPVELAFFHEERRQGWNTFYPLPHWPRPLDRRRL